MRTSLAFLVLWGIARWGIARGGESEAAPADFSPEALRAREVLLRSALERALGECFASPVEIEVVDPDGMEAVLREEFAGLFRRMMPGATPEEAEKAARATARSLRSVLLGKLRLKDGVVCICPENFRRQAARDPAWKGYESQPLLDVILLHEMAHAYQHRTFGIDRVQRLAASTEQLQAVGALVEGHAQYLARKAASPLGLDASVALMIDGLTRAPSSIRDPAEIHAFEVMQSLFAFGYVEGEKFVAAIAAALGEKEGPERLFREPPLTLRAVSRPDEYLTPPPAAGEAEARLAAERLQKIAAGRFGKAEQIGVPLPTILSALSALGPEAAARGGKLVRSALAVVAQPVPGAQAISSLILCESPAAAVEFLELQRALSRKRDELFSRPGATRIVRSAVEETAVVGLRAAILRKTVESGERWTNVATLLVADGSMNFEIARIGVPAPTEAMVRDAREAVLLVRAAAAAAAGDGAATLEAKEGSARWLALRHLRESSADEAEKAAFSASKDEDPLVRGEAYAILRERGRGAEAARLGLEEGDPFLRAECLAAVDRDETLAEAERAAILTASTAHESALVRRAAFEGLFRLGRSREIPPPALVAALSDPDEDLRSVAAAVLPVDFAKEADPASIAALVKASREGPPDLRIELMRAMAKSSRPEAVGRVIEALRDSNRRVRLAAVTAIAYSGADYSGAAAELVPFLEDDLAASSAAKALGRMGEAARPFAAALRKALDGADPRSRIEAAIALCATGDRGAEVVEAVGAALESDNPLVQDRAIDAATALGPEAAVPLLDRLRSLLGSLEHDWDRLRVVEFLGRMGPAAAAALPELDALKEKGDPTGKIEEAAARIRAR